MEKIETLSQLLQYFGAKSSAELVSVIYKRALVGAGITLVLKDGVRLRPGERYAQSCSGSPLWKITWENVSNEQVVGFYFSIYDKDARKDFFGTFLKIPVSVENLKLNIEALKFQHITHS